MFSFLKSRSKEPLHRNENQENSLLPPPDHFSSNLIRFQVYSIGILHPDNWNVFINPSRKFSFYDGAAKIDRSSEKNSGEQASLALRWARLPHETNVDEYMDEIANSDETVR